MPTNPYYQGPPSDHFDGQRFFNPGQCSTDRSLGDMLRWKLTKRAARWPKSVPVTPAKPEPRVAGLRITMVGHATLLIQTAGHNLLTDPWWSERASPLRRLGPKRVAAPGIDFDDLPPIDTILLSHNHYDHLDRDTLARLEARDHPLIVTPLGNDVILRQKLPEAQIEPRDWSDQVALGNNVIVTIVPAHHWSSRTGRDARMALWGGFMLRSPAGLAYFAGDTGLGDGAIFAAMRREHGAPDLAAIPIGAYAPRWFMRDQHTDPDDAVEILLKLEARRAIGIHWGVLQLTDEPHQQPAERLAEALYARDIDPLRFVAATPGDVYDHLPAGDTAAAEQDEAWIS